MLIGVYIGRGMSTEGIYKDKTSPDPREVKLLLIEEKGIC